MPPTVFFSTCLLMVCIVIVTLPVSDEIHESMACYITKRYKTRVDISQELQEKYRKHARKHVWKDGVSERSVEHIMWRSVIWGILLEECVQRFPSKHSPTEALLEMALEIYSWGLVSDKDSQIRQGDSFRLREAFLETYSYSNTLGNCSC